jgi:hypothetical protein
MQPMEWGASEVMGNAWTATKANLGVLIGAFIVMGMITSVIQQVLQAIFGGGHQPSPEELRGIHDFQDYMRLVQGMQGSPLPQILAQIPGAFLTAGILKIHLSVARGQAPQFGDLFSGGPRFLSMLGTQILVGLAVIVGFIFLIVPGIYLALAFSQAQYYVVDKGMNPIDAMKASFEATKGQKGNLFVYGLLACVVGFLGLCACCVGIIVAVPVIQVGMAMIYTRLTGTAYAQGPTYGPPGGWGPPGGFGPGGYGGPPPGAYGPPGGYGPPAGGYGPPGGGGYGPPGGGPPPYGGAGY